MTTLNNNIYYYFQGDPEHPICPVMLGDARLAGEFADEMLGTSLYFQIL